MLLGSIIIRDGVYIWMLISILAMGVDVHDVPLMYNVPTIPVTFSPVSYNFRSHFQQLEF